MKTRHNGINRTKFVFINKMKETIKEIFEIKSKKGMNVAGKTNKLDKI